MDPRLNRLASLLTITADDILNSLQYPLFCIMYRENSPNYNKKRQNRLIVFATISLGALRVNIHCDTYDFIVCINKKRKLLAL